MKIKHWLWLILGASVLLRVLAALYLGNQVIPLPGIFDQISYHTLATRVLEGHGFSFGTQWWPMTKPDAPTAHWSFLYTFYLVGVYSIFGINPLIARLVQAVVVGLAGPWLVYWLAMATFKKRSYSSVEGVLVPEHIALLAAAWFAFYGYFVYYAAALMTESFFILCILWSLDCALRLLESGKPWHFIELGLAAGSAVLLRQTYLFFIPFLIGWLVWASWRRKGDGLRLRTLTWGGLATVLVLFLMVAPVTYSNYRRFGHFVLLNTNAGYAFFWANHPVHGISFAPLYTDEMPSYQEVIPLELRDLDEAALDKELMKLGLRFIVDDPGRFFLLSLSRIPVHFMFWPSPASSLPSNLTRVLSIGVALPFMLAGGWLWFLDLRRKWINAEPGCLLVVLIVIYVSLHLVSWASVRYRLPTDAVGLIFAARALYQLLVRFRFPLNQLIRA